MKFARWNQLERPTASELTGSRHQSDSARGEPIAVKTLTKSGSAITQTKYEFEPGETPDWPRTVGAQPTWEERPSLELSAFLFGQYKRFHGPHCRAPGVVDVDHSKRRGTNAWLRSLRR